MHKAVNRNADLACKIVHADSDMSFAGIVSGNNNGEVWVDSLSSPSLALVWSEHLQCFQWMGSHTCRFHEIDLYDFLNLSIPEFVNTKGLDYVEYACDQIEWYPIIRNALPNRNVWEDWQLVYKTPKEFKPDNASAELAHGYELHQIDDAFLRMIDAGDHIKNGDFLFDKLIPCWGEPGNYLRLGNGYAAICDDEIASIAMTDTRYMDICSIGVETLKSHQRKGLSGTLAQVLVSDLHQQRLVAWWDCMECNRASQKTAQRSGLEFDHRYKVCWYNC